MSCGAFHIAEEVHCTIQSTAEQFDIKSFIFKNLHLKKASLASRIFFLPIIDLFVIFSYLDFFLFLFCLFFSFLVIFSFFANFFLFFA